MMDFLGRPEQIRNGSFASGRWVAVQGRYAKPSIMESGDRGSSSERGRKRDGRQ